MKKILLLVLSIVLASCQIEYDGTSKYVVKTKIIDAKGAPIEGVRVIVTVSAGSLADDIAIGTTDKDGLATLLFPPPVNETSMLAITFQNTILNGQSSVYLTKTINNLQKSDFEDYIFDTGEIVLLKETEVTECLISATLSNSNSKITSFSTNAILAGDSINFNNSQNIWLPLSLVVLKNQTFTIAYSITNYGTTPPNVVSYTHDITVGEEPVSYNIAH